MMCQASSSQHFKAPWSFNTSETTHQVTQRHILEDVNLQQHCCKNLKSCMSCSVIPRTWCSLALQIVHPSVTSCKGNKIHWKKLILVHFTLSVPLTTAIYICIWWKRLNKSGCHKFFPEVLFLNHRASCEPFGAGIKCPVWCVGDQNLNESCIGKPLNGHHVDLTFSILSITLWDGYT
jgi:hypothetical protein